MKLNTTCAALALTAGLGAVSQAALIAGTVTATEQFGATGNYSTANLITGATASTDTIAIDQYGVTGWLSANGDATIGGETITHDFGSVVALDTLHLWNWNRFQDGSDNDRGVNGFTVAISDDNTSFTDVGTFGATMEAAGASGGTISAQSFGLGDQNAQYVRITVNTNHGNAGFVGIEELHYENVTPIPEPSSTALLGLGGLALILRRRK